MFEKIKMRFAIAMWAGCLSLLSMPAFADDYSAGWGPAVGVQMPLLQAPDQNGDVKTLADLAGDQGLLLFLSRSADW